MQRSLVLVWRHSYNVFVLSGWSKHINATHLYTCQLTRYYASSQTVAMENTIQKRSACCSHHDCTLCRTCVFFSITLRAHKFSCRTANRVMCLCIYIVLTVCACFAISLVQLVNPESQIHAQKCYTSETRPSFRGWRGWQARLPLYS